nr:autotransporter adhesin family protein [Escherichia coli]
MKRHLNTSYRLNRHSAVVFQANYPAMLLQQQS